MLRSREFARLELLVVVAIVETDYCDVPYEILLGVGRFDPARAGVNSHAVEHSCIEPACHDQGHNHSKAFSTWSFETDHPLALEVLRETKRRLPATVYRVKGVIYSTDAPQRRAVLQVVGRRMDISLQDEWGGRTPRTQIVVIGAAAGIDPVMLGRQFNTTVAPNREAAEIAPAAVS